MDTVSQVVAKKNPRYVCYATVHRKTPDAMLAADRERFPGGHMAGFMIWIRQRWHEYRGAHGIHPDAPISPAQHDHFTEWLERKVSDPLQRIRLCG